MAIVTDAAADGWDEVEDEAVGIEDALSRGPDDVGGVSDDDEGIFNWVVTKLSLICVRRFPAKDMAFMPSFAPLLSCGDR